MIIKKRGIPLIILALQALLRRLPQNHLKRPLILTELNRRLAGFRGEEAIDYHLDELCTNTYHIFHSLRLAYKGHNFQIDCLLNTPYFVLILEVKNYSYTLTFHSDSEQLIQNKQGVEKTLPNPVPQVKRHKRLLHKWLRKHNYPELPIETLAVITNPTAIIKSDDKSIFQIVCPIASLLQRIELMEKYHNQTKLNSKELRKLDKSLLKDHSEKTPNLLQKYQISPSELYTGVQCPHCLRLPLPYNRGKWFCSNCQKDYKGMLHQTIRDYFLLIKETITNSEFRHFLHISSPDVATKMILSMNFPSEGSTKAKVYHLAKFIKFEFPN